MMDARARNKRLAERQLAGAKATRLALDEKTKALLLVDEDGVRRGDLLR